MSKLHPMNSNSAECGFSVQFCQDTAPVALLVIILFFPGTIQEAVFAFKVVYGLGTSYLRNRILSHILACPLRSSEGALICMPLLAEARVVGKKR